VVTRMSFFMYRVTSHVSSRDLLKALRGVKYGVAFKRTLRLKPEVFRDNH
jgi:hypothetical protein